MLASKLVLGLFALAIIIGGLFSARLALGPIPIDSFAPQIANAIGERFGHGYEFGIGRIAIARDGFVAVLSIDELSVREASGRTILTAPKAEVSVDPLGLIVGRVTLKRLEILDVELRLALRPNGSLALPLSAESGEALDLTPPLRAADAPMSPLTPSPAGPPPRLEGTADGPRSPPESQLAAALRLFIDTLTNPASLVSAIDRIGIMRGKIVIDDETKDQKAVFNGVDLEFDRSSGTTRFRLSVDGPNGRWLASGAASGIPSSERSLSLAASNLSLDEILLVAGTRTIGVDFDMPLSGGLDILLSADGMISEAAGQFEFGAGYLRFEDPDSEPMMADKISGGLHWNPVRRRIVIDRGQLTAGPTHFAVSGSVAPPELEGGPWGLQLASAESNVWGPERPGEKPILIDRAELTARLYLAGKKLGIDRFSFSGPQCGLALAGAIDWINGPHMRLGASISPTPVTALTRLWPSFVAASVRSYLLSRAGEGMVEKGTMQVDFDAADMRAIQAGHAPPDAKALVEFTITNGSLNFLPGVPPLIGMDGVGRVTGRTATFTVSNATVDPGSGRVLSLHDGRFQVADSDPAPVPALVEAKVTGSVEAIGELLSFDALKPYASLPLDSSTLKGQANGSFELAMNLGSGAAPSDTTLKVDAMVTNLTAERLIGNEKLEGATLTINVDSAGLRANGQGSMFGGLAAISIEKPKGKAAEASIGLNLDDAMRAKHGFGALPGVSGPIGAKITAPIGTGEKPKARIELDLIGAAIEIPGVSKPAGRPGKMAFALTVNDASTSIDQIIVDAGTVQGRGKMELGAGYSLIAASFPQLKFSPGDEMRIDAAGAGDTVKVVVRGSTIDARPFLKSLIFNPSGGGGAEESTREERTEASQGKEVEFDVKADILTGYNKQMITGSELRFAKRGAQVKQFTFAGTFGGQQISSNLTGGSTAPQLNLVSDDAGSLLSFLDLYKHMEHGRLSVGMLLGTNAIAGVLVINNFVLRDEPALRRLVVEGVPQPDASDRAQKIDTNAVAFNKLQVRFQREGSRLTLSQGTMHGEAIGLTVEGAVDYAHDRVDMRGTFVPIFAVNNMFAKIPVVGLILGGSSDEGLIGVNYRISGLASAPTLSINPLSAIAPGIFRQIFGVVDFDPMNPQR
ncbi:MAG: DUF3971 domain-containing protein [Beijerinckiaceae bacterium]|nr:DUF3971 domain-containing protein [Beijerinckiaceae bacterium]MCI0737347.1 DUF3971 domain-containing protein [Beijerinckiaceae bacterium]